MITAIDDNAVVDIVRLFNESNGKDYLLKRGIPEETVNQLDLLGFSGIANVLSAIKFAKYYELGSNDIVATVLTDSMELYATRIDEYRETFGAFTEEHAAIALGHSLHGAATDNMLELTYPERRRVHNLKYYTWVEQQGKTYEEIVDQWYDPDYWTEVQAQVPEIDKLIDEFNQQVGLL
jgi:hypothetical protein